MTNRNFYQIAIAGLLICAGLILGAPAFVG